MVDGSKEVNSPAWWFDRLMAGFDARLPRKWNPDVASYSDPRDNDTRRDRFERLWAYHAGRPPLPQVSAEYTETFRAAMRKARSNYAGMCTSAMLNRMGLAGVSTAKDKVGGDDLVARIDEVSNLATEFGNLFAYLFVMSESYAMAVAPKPGTDGAAMIKALDPRDCIGDPDPENPRLLRALLVRGHDPMLGIDTAKLFLPGKMYRASKATNTFGVGLAKWEWDGEPENIEGIDELGGIPAVRFENKDGLGEFEAHLDVLDRINDTTLQRIILAWYQSFRQRAIEGDLEGDDDEPMTLEEFRDIFRADPGSLWRVPAGVKFWESQPTDLTPIVNAKRDDVKEFMAVTSTPMYLASSDAVNQSAEGASLVREGINHKVGDRRSSTTPGLKLIIRMAFALSGDAARGAQIKLAWNALENNSLADKGSATAQVKGVLPLRRIYTDIWGMTPDEAEECITELAAEQLLLGAATANLSAPNGVANDPTNSAV